MSHPEYPQSNVAKFSGYDPDKYAIDDVSPTFRTDETLMPNRPPTLTQGTTAKFLQPLTRDLVEVTPRPTINELPDAVIENMVKKDKAFWIDKPGSNAYTLHDAYYNYGMTAEKMLPPHQGVFPRSYQYDLDCVKYRRQNACKGFKGDKELTHTYIRADSARQTSVTCNCQPLDVQCRSCTDIEFKKVASSISETSQKRWRHYPDLTTKLSPEQIRNMMDEFGQPFKNEACNWYFQNYPSIKYDCIVRKFSK